MNQKMGVIYTVTKNTKFLDEAVISAKSVKKYCPNLHITLFTDLDNIQEDCFDNILPSKVPVICTGRAPIIENMINSPYEKTLALDSDTLILNSKILDLFRLLDHFDVAVAHAPVRVAGEIPNIPGCFPEFNCGAILFKKSDKVINALKEWHKVYTNNINNLKREHGQGGVQTSFRYVMWHSTLRIATLTPEYNNRCTLNKHVYDNLVNNNNTIILHDRRKIQNTVMTKLKLLQKFGRKVWKDIKNDIPQT